MLSVVATTAAAAVVGGEANVSSVTVVAGWWCGDGVDCNGGSGMVVRRRCLL